jgi:hypothetical protein
LTLSQIASTGRDGGLVFDYGVPRASLGLGRTNDVRCRVAPRRIGGRAIFIPSSIPRRCTHRLTDTGFSSIVDLDHDGLNARYSRTARMACASWVSSVALSARRADADWRGLFVLGPRDGPEDDCRRRLGAKRVYASPNFNKLSAVATIASSRGRGFQASTRRAFALVACRT